jgi:histidine triad (HIT) family protein
MATIFSRIAQGEIPSYRVASDDRHYAFLDINPVAEGHVLVIPRVENDYIFNLDSDDYQSLWAFARRVAKALEKAVPCKRIGVTVIGLEVPHAHIHLVPITKESDMNFSKPKMTLPAERMEQLAKAISEEFEKLDA